MDNGYVLGCKEIGIPQLFWTERETQSYGDLGNWQETGRDWCETYID